MTVIKRKTEAKKRGKMAELLGSLAVEEGFTPSPLDDVQFFRASQPVPRTPVAYDSSIVIVGQGRKKGYLGDRVFTYDAYNYLVLSVPLPFECEIEARPEDPLLGVMVHVEPAVLSELLLSMDDSGVISRQAPLGIYSTPMTDELVNAVVRLLECLKNPMDSRILGPQIVREITYRVLCGEQGGALRAVVARHSHFSQIARVLKRIHSDYHTKLDIESLADEANMGLSAFHQNFKAVTAASPLQYLKSIRLHKARQLMVQDGFNASTAAGNVGYESVSQFSREFKRFFGNSPVNEAIRVRTMTRYPYPV